MRLLHPAAIAASLTLIATAANAQLTLISLEQHHRQTSNSTTSVAGYSFYATAEGFDTVTSATVTATAGSLSGTDQQLPDRGDFFEYEDESPATALALTTNYPLGATYTITLAGTPSGTVSITNTSGKTFTELLPDAPVFTLTGANSQPLTGTWSIEGNQSVFTFDSTSVTSFTVTTNGYSVVSPQGHYAGYFSVADTTNTWAELGEVGVGPVADPIGDTPGYTPPVFTFTKDLAPDADDLDDSTYGFTNGTEFELEAGFFNVIGLTDSGLNDGSQKAFIVGTTTSFILRAQASAIPEPSTYAQIFGAVAAVGAVIYRRRRKQR